MRDDIRSGPKKQSDGGEWAASPGSEGGKGSGVPFATARQSALTAGDLLACFERARLSPSDMPTLEMCEHLLPFLPPACPTDIEHFGATIGTTAAQAAADLLQELSSVEAYWQAHFAVACQEALIAGVRQDPSETWQKAVFDPLRDLRRSLLQCKGLLTPSPDPFPESRPDAIDALLDLFMEAARLTKRNRKKIGTSSEGPASRFMRDALFRLGYGTITGDAISQHFKRRRSTATRP